MTTPNKTQNVKQNAKSTVVTPSMKATVGKPGFVTLAPFDPYAVLKAPLSTEKSIRQIEFENKLAFVVDQRSTKRDVKEAVEQLFKVKVTAVNIQNSVQGQKRAYVRLASGSLASDVSADLGLI